MDPRRKAWVKIHQSRCQVKSKRLSSHGPEKIKIKVGDLSQPLRIKNKLTDADGKETRLNPEMMFKSP
jgi:hypothetical protein